MNKRNLIHTGKMAESTFVDPNAVAWAHVRGLFVMDMETEDRKWIFWPCVLFADDTWLVAQNTTDITSARQCCARLAAIHDKPVRDWTRTVPATIPREGFLYNISNVVKLPENLAAQVPDEEPQWGCGWDATDELFEDGVPDHEFVQSLEDTASIMRRTWLEEPNVDRARLEEAIVIHKDEAIRRWRMLHAANVKPPYTADVD